MGRLWIVQNIKEKACLFKLLHTILERPNSIVLESVTLVTPRSVVIFSSVVNFEHQRSRELNSFRITAGKLIGDTETFSNKFQSD